ncbi:hypothetical protein FQA39_LY10220 [Lamprigera yunnana]|nr:hypothetical protein FQA39_LY10220 [Lamprigera yunnana]
MNPNENRQDKVTSGADLDETVHVYCRLRPLQDECEVPCIKLVSPTVLNVASDSKSKVVRREYRYVFKHIFTSYSNQREIFDHVGLPLLEDLVNGKNSLLFAYGVTGSGKTYTLTGDQTHPGIMPACVNTLFNSIGEQQAHKYVIKSDRLNGFEVQSENEALEERFREAKNNKRIKSLKKATGDKVTYVNDGIKLSTVNNTSLYSVFLSYTEIYNNAVYDLLDEANGKVLQAKIIREDSRKNMYVNGVEEVEVKSAAEAFELFSIGQKRKRIAHTLLNSESSRSHSIFNIRVVQFMKSSGDIPAQTLLQVGQLSIVDLAGSERSNRTNNTGMRLKEASSINNSLMTLRTCLETLRENQVNHTNKVIPYRDSRLTLLFKNYFEGDGQVRMFVCINPSHQDYEENLQVLKFAEMTQEVQVIKTESRHLQFKTPNSKSTLKTVTSKTPVLKTPGTLTWPTIQSVELNPEDPEKNSAVLDKLLSCLQSRRNRRGSIKHDLSQKEQNFRKRLVKINQESILSCSEIRSLKATMKKQKASSQNLNVKIADLETLNNNMVSKNKELLGIIHNLQLTIDEKNLKLNQNCLENEKSKQKFVQHTEKLNKELDIKLRQQRHEMEIEMQAKELKLKKMKEIIENDEIVSSEGFSCVSPKLLYYQEPNENLPPHSTNRSAITPKSSKSINRIRALPGQVWLEHNAIKPIPLNTVMQPSMKKRKSVDKLKKAADVTNPKQNKYCLIAQEPDATGDVETKLYKADIIPTCSGGAQVVFNGVECLREESPIKQPFSPCNK